MQTGITTIVTRRALVLGDQGLEEVVKGGWNVVAALMKANLP